MLTGRFGPSLLWLRGVKPNLKEAARKFRINIGLLDFGSGSIIEALTDECESQPFLLSGKRWLHLPDYLQHRLARVSVGLGEKPSRPERRKVGKSQPHLCRNSISVIKTRAKRAETRYKAKDDNDDQTTTSGFLDGFQGLSLFKLGLGVETRLQPLAQDQRTAPDLQAPPLWNLQLFAPLQNLPEQLRLPSTSFRRTLTETFLWAQLEAPELWLPPTTPTFSLVRRSGPSKVRVCPGEGSVSPRLAGSPSSTKGSAEVGGGPP